MAGDHQVILTGRSGSELAVRLVVPGSFTERYDVLEALRSSRDAHRPAIAALGLCLPYLRRRLPYAGDPIAFGGQVFDQLIAEGWTIGSLMSAASVALRLCRESIDELTREVDRELGNSEGPAGASS